jgi:hypothetical protein
MGTPKLLTGADLRDLIRKRVVPATTQGAVARSLGITPGYLSEVLKGYREPTDTLAAALGFKRVIRYIPLKED